MDCFVLIHECIYCRFLACGYHEVFIYMYNIVLSSWCLNCKCISSIVHFYPFRLVIADVDIVFVCG